MAEEAEVGAETGPGAGGKVSFEEMTGNSSRVLWGGFCFMSWRDSRILKC